MTCLEQLEMKKSKAVLNGHKLELCISVQVSWHYKYIFKDAGAAEDYVHIWSWKQNTWALNIELQQHLLKKLSSTSAAKGSGEDRLFSPHSLC